MSDSPTNKLYNTFLASGVHDCDVAKRLDAYGVESTFDSETNTLELAMPVGWNDTMSVEDHASVVEGWCIDDATLNVTFNMHLTQKGLTRVDALTLVEIDDEATIELSTAVKQGAFEFVENVFPGTELDIKLVATVKMANGPPKTLKLIEGRINTPSEPAALGNNTAGMFFAVAGGIALFAHYDIGTPGRVTHFAFMGKMSGLETHFSI